MTKTQATLLLSRPKAQSEEFLALCEKQAGRRLPVVISPVIQIDFLDRQPDFDAYATLIFTSSHGVAACANELPGRRVVTVGAKTCARAKAAGANAISLGEDVETFLVRGSEVLEPALHCRGTHVRGNLAFRLSEMGVATEEAILYDQVAQSLTPPARSLLLSRSSVVVPLFSPRSAELLSKNVIKADVKVIAMSSAVADSWNGPGSVDIASAPTALEMAVKTIRHF